MFLRRYLRVRVYLFSLLITSSCISEALAGEFQPLDSIHSAIRQFIQSNFQRSEDIRIGIGLNDRRLRLSLCEQALEVFWSNRAKKIGLTSVGVRCNSQSNWTIYAPVKIKHYVPIVVATTTLPRGHRLKPTDYKLEKRDISQLSSGYLTQPGQFTGYIVKRQLNPGQIILPNVLQAPKLVHRGEKVILLAELEGIQVRSQGVALQDGAEGQTISIRNSRSRRVVEGRVLAPGVVEILL